jgi:hypothetical protein
VMGLKEIEAKPKDGNPLPGEPKYR